MNESNESRLKKALKTKGILTLITSSSRSCREVLCPKFVLSDQLIEVSGYQIQTQEDFWTQLSGKLIPEKVENNKHLLIRHMILHEKVLVIENFHRLPLDVQKYMIQVFKAELFHGLKIVLDSPSTYSDMIPRLNPEMIGRVCYINLE